MDALILIAGLALPWLLGLSLLVSFREGPARWQRPGELAWMLGCGWFVGSFLVTVWMRAISLGGLKFGPASLVVPIAALVGVFGFIAFHRHGRALGIPFRSALKALSRYELSGVRRLLWLVLLSWISIRLVVMLFEVSWIPLFPWDAWAQWADKAHVWFELKSMAPFVTSSEWLIAGSPSVYYDPAPHYPATVPLWQTWIATLLGRWDDALVNLPWWLTGIALGLLVYGFLAQRKFSLLSALLGAWVVLSLPILDVHIALAGYADLAMGGFLTATFLSALRWLDEHRASDAVITLVLGVACTTIKNPGILWMLLLIPALSISSVPRYGIRLFFILSSLVVLAAALLAYSEVRILGYSLRPGFVFPWRGLLTAFFVFDNWHLLWYGLLAVAMLSRRQLFSPALGPFTVSMTTGLAFLLFGFTFTNAGAWVEDQTTVNRAALHLAPLLVVWMFFAYRAWVEDAGRTAASRSAPVREIRESARLPAGREHA